MPKTNHTGCSKCRCGFNPKGMQPMLLLLPHDAGLLKGCRQLSGCRLQKKSVQGEHLFK